MIFIILYTSLFTVMSEYGKIDLSAGDTSVHSLLGIVLGLFLVFRTNTAYDKWWEGRKIWGSVVNDSRNFAMKINAFLNPADKGTRRLYARLITNYVVAIKEHLRDGVKLEELREVDEAFFPQIVQWQHKPNYIASRMFNRLNELYKDGEITGDQLFILDKEAKSFTDHVGKCERIKKTPIPYAYSMYMKKFIFFYAISLPFGFLEKFHYWTIPVVALIFYFLLTIELIAEEIEDPFGLDDNDLPTGELSKSITVNVDEILDPETLSAK